MIIMKKKSYRCARCKKTFSTWHGLRIHSQKHLKSEALNDIKLLQKGAIPKKSKIGSGFKGRNKVVIT